MDDNQHNKAGVLSSCCEAAKTAPLPRADPPRQAVPYISMESASRRGLLGKVLKEFVDSDLVFN